MHAALSGVFMQIFNHGITAAALFYFVGLLEQRRGLRGINDFGGLMQRTPLLCGWMSVAMFSSLGLPGLNGFIGEFLIFKGSFAVAASFTAVAVFGLFITAIVFMRAMQALFSGPLAETCDAFTDLRRSEKWVDGSGHAAHVRHRHRAAIRLQHLQHNRGPDGAAVCLTMGKDVIPIYPIAEKILYLREQKIILDRDLARLYGVQTRVLNQAVKRNSGRFPSDFAFILSRAEIERISQFVTSSSTLRFSKQVRVFTEQGVTTLSRGRCDE